MSGVRLAGLSDPSWPNHLPLLSLAGLKLESYPYYDRDAHTIDFDAMMACFEKLEDPRRGNAGRHDLLEILVIALCSVLCGGQTAVDMAEFGEAEEDFLRRFLEPFPLAADGGGPPHEAL